MAYEILQRIMHAQYQPVDAVELEDRIGADWGLYSRVIERSRIIERNKTISNERLRRL